VPTGGVLGTNATDFFCTAVETGSGVLISLLRNPGPTLFALAAILGLLVYLIARATWRPVAPLRVARRRTWGQILSAAGRMYVKRAPLFLGIGLLFIPLAGLISLLQALLIGGLGLVGVDTTGEGAGALALLVVTLGTTLTLLGLTLALAATACALVRIDRGEAIGPIQAYRIALTKIRALLGALGLAVGAWVALTATGILLPVAIWLGVRWSLLAPVVELEDRSPVAALRRSSELVRRRWPRVASLVGISAVLALVAGPLLGALLIFLTDAPLPLLNVVAGIVYGLAMPFVALVTAYVYFDARTRHELEPADEPDELPAEIEVAG
jgi:hypothetical protein